MTRQSGFDQLQTWIPQSVIDQVNLHDAVTAEVARELVGTALSTTLIVIATLLAVAGFGRLRNALFGRAHFRKTAGFLAFTRKVSAIVVAGAPWWPVWQLTEGAPPGDGHVALGAFAALAWACAIAADHSGAWLDRRHGTIELRQGFAIFAVKRLSIQLDRALVDVRSGQPIGGLLSAVRSGRASMPVALAPAAWQAVNQQLDRATALEFMAAALATFGLRFAAPAVTAGEA